METSSNPVAAGIRALVRLGKPSTPCADDLDDGALVESDPLAAPSDLATGEIPTEVVRAFAFLDICGFTSFTDQFGAQPATASLAVFRGLVRALAAQRGVRVAKWLGDGVLVVSVDPSALVAFVVDVVSRTSGGALEVRAGIASGPSLIFDGDDYIGRHVNLASRLCDKAGPGEVLAASSLLEHLPNWVQVKSAKSVAVRGMGKVSNVSTLVSKPEIEIPKRFLAE